MATKPQSVSGNANRNYELFVRDIVEALLKADGLTIKVDHDVQIQGISRWHQIDVYWEYKLGGLQHRVVINCKNYASTIKVTHVETLAGVLNDMPGVRGIIVTTKGFQKGAIDYAKVHQIGLKVIRPPVDQDWEGRIRQVDLQVIIQRPVLLEAKISLNKAWAEAQPEGADAMTGTATYRADVTVVRDLDSARVEDLNALWNRAMREHSTSTGEEHAAALSWSNAFLHSEGRPPRKIDSIEFRWRYDHGTSTSTVVARDPKAIVKDAIDGTLLFVDPDGQVSGDTEQGDGSDQDEN
jgi:hypothetical protein